MLELCIAKDVLSEILYENKTFKHALHAKCFSNNEYKKYKTIVSALVGCELRHHFLIKKVLSKLGVDLTSEERIVLSLAITNNHFLKRLPQKDVNEYLKGVFHEKYPLIVHVLDEKLSLFDYVEIEHRSIEFLSLKFNLPKWLLKNFIKEIGLSKTYRIAQTLSKPLNQTYRANPYNEKAKSILDNSKKILGQERYPSIYEVPRKLLREHPELNGEHLFRIDYHIKELIDEYQNELVGEVSVYAEQDDSLVLELLARSKNKLGVNVVCPNYEERTNLVRSVRLQKAKNIYVFKANDVTSMKTGISRKQELFYCFPESSSYSFINVYPDYIVRFRSNIIDGFVNKQKDALEKCSNFVCDGGSLIYLVDTMDYRETKEVTQCFLSSHPEFSLVKEKQMIPEKNHGSFLYYAILKLENQDGEN